MQNSSTLKISGEIKIPDLIPQRALLSNWIRMKTYQVNSLRIFGSFSRVQWCSLNIQRSLAQNRTQLKIPQSRQIGRFSQEPMHFSETTYSKAFFVEELILNDSMWFSYPWKNQGTLWYKQDDKFYHLMYAYILNIFTARNSYSFGKKLQTYRTPIHVLQRCRCYSSALCLFL